MDIYVRIFVIEFMTSFIWRSTSAGEWLPWNVFEYYFENKIKVKWPEVIDECSRIDAALTSILSDEENTFIRNNLNGRAHIIGLLPGQADCTCYNVTQSVCTACRNSWTWVDGTPMGYHNWGPSEPVREQYAMITSNGNWECPGFLARLLGRLGFICKRHLCENIECLHGRCQASEGAAYCRCNAGYTGQFCETDIDYCLSSPCRNNGTCIDHVNSYSCLCARGYNGTDCETGSYGRESAQTEENHSLRNVLLITLTSTLIIIIVVIVLTIIFWRKCKHGKTPIDNVTEPSIANQADYENICMLGQPDNQQNSTRVTTYEDLSINRQNEETNEGAYTALQVRDEGQDNQERALYANA